MRRTTHKGVYEICKGKYRVRAQGVSHATGRRQEKQATVLGKLTDAVAKHAELLAEIMSVPRARRITLSEFADGWHERKRAKVKYRTWEKYGHDLTLHILPALGDVYMDALMPSMVEGFMSAELESGAAKNSVTNRLKLLRQISADAMAERLIDGDFCQRVRAPNETRYSDDEPNMLTGEQLHAVLAAIPAYWRPVAYTLAFTGLRWSSITALRWEDLDAEAHTLRFERMQHKGEVCSGSKGNRGKVQTSPIPEELTMILLRHRRRMIEDQHPGVESGWMFPTRVGSLHRGAPLRVVLKAACKKAGVEIRFTPHGLRRTFNDLARRGAERQVVKALVGHTTDRMHEHYSHIDLGEKRDAVAKVVQLVREK